jgi:hypothetical protein
MATESESPKSGTKTAAEVQKAADEAGADEVQASFDEAAEKGYFGETPDPTPRENYTASGVGQGLPTPESDPEVRMNQPPRLTY